MKGTLRKYCALLLIPLIALSARADDDDNPCPPDGDPPGPCYYWTGSPDCQWAEVPNCGCKPMYKISSILNWSGNADLDIYAKNEDTGEVCYFGHKSAFDFMLNHDAHPGCNDNPSQPEEITSGNLVKWSHLSFWYDQYSDCENQVSPSEAYVILYNIGDMILYVNGTVVPPGGIYTTSLAYAGYNTGSSSDFTGGTIIDVTYVPCVELSVDPSDEEKTFQLNEANGREQFATVKGSGNVILKATISPDTPEIRELIDWQGATEYPSDPTKATISRTSSKKQPVSVLVDGNTCAEADVWVVWANLSVRHSGVKTPWDLNDVGNKAEFDPWVEGISHQLGPTDRLSETPPYLGYKIEVKADLTPQGVGSVVVDDWKFYQSVSYVEFYNSMNITDRDTDLPDTGVAVDLTPDINDNVFALDAPGIAFVNGTSGFSSWKAANNFTVILKWKDTVCSDETDWWSKQKLEYDGSNFTVFYNDGGDGFITLPTTY